MKMEEMIQAAKEQRDKVIILEGEIEPSINHPDQEKARWHVTYIDGKFIGINSINGAKSEVKEIALRTGISEEVYEENRVEDIEHTSYTLEDFQEVREQYD